MGAVFGAYGFDLVDGSRYLIHADAVILATGGHTRIWRRTSSRRDENTGDSFRLAAEAGARIRDAELVQFHPSGLLEPENAAGTLVSEAARGEGAVLLNNLGERFMARYDPARMELSTRDRVALASYTEIKEGRGTRGGGVWLDLSQAAARDDPDPVAARLPDPARPADARRHARPDRGRADRALLDGRGLGAARGPQHRNRRTVRDRGGRERTARGQPARRELARPNCSSTGESPGRQRPSTPPASARSAAPWQRSRKQSRPSTGCSRPTATRTYARCSVPSAT